MNHSSSSSPTAGSSAPSEPFADIDAAVAAIARGEMIVVVDSPARENEGDLVMAAEKVTPVAVNFMATDARGLICVPMLQERLHELGIDPMVSENGDRMRTAFHVSVDHRGRTTTGISAADRAATIRRLADPASVHEDFVQPGHVLPLAYREGGVFERAGHTEAAIDLCRMAGMQPAAVICEIAADDGEMARLPGLISYARRHSLLMITISDLIFHRRRCEQRLVRKGMAPGLDPSTSSPEAAGHGRGVGGPGDARSHSEPRNASPATPSS